MDLTKMTNEKLEKFIEVNLNTIKNDGVGENTKAFMKTRVEDAREIIRRRNLEDKNDNELELTPADRGKLTDEELEMAENFDTLSPAEKAEIEQIIRIR